MKIVARAAFAGGMLAFLPMTAAADPVDMAGLKTLVEGLGYAASPVGTEGTKISITYTTPNFNVPIGFEVTPSKRYVWATANLGVSKLTGETALALLKRGGTYQPTQFWINTNGNLMVGIAVENDDLKPERMRSAIQKLGDDVSKTSDLWQGPVAATPTP